ncbi:MAG: hypothetical protein HQK49_17565 [Oligoflexia bacterium]|nr:hypothetical protein [Oligoflexia bacterium]
MFKFEKTNLFLNKKVDPKHYRHFVNKVPMVLHCHHYSTLYTQLALDAKEEEVLLKSMEEAIYPILENYYKDNNIERIDDKVEVACQYFSFMGLGKMSVISISENSAEVHLLRSHLDEGWIKKFGKYDRPINYIASGFIAAMFEVINDKRTNTAIVQEVQSIAKGAERAVFRVSTK